MLQPHIFLTRSCVSIAATAVVPVSVHIAILGVVMFFMGVSLGGLDNGEIFA